jgi:hypothetical protein
MIRKRCNRNGSRLSAIRIAVFVIVIADTNEKDHNDFQGSEILWFGVFFFFERELESC